MFEVSVYSLQLLTFIFLNLILSLSMVITLSSGQLSLSHAGFMSIGAYTSAILSKLIPLPLAMISGAGLAAIAGLLAGYPALRLSGLYLAIATLGFGEVVRVTMLNLEITNGALGLSRIPSLGSVLHSYFPLPVAAQKSKALLSLFSVSSIFFIIYFILYRFRHSPYGYVLTAISDDEKAAASTGISVKSYKLASFVAGAFLAGFGGALYAHLTTSITPEDFAYHRAVEILSFCVIGGVETLIGPILGTIFLTLLPEWMRFLSDYKMIFYGLLLLSVMAFRPAGLITVPFINKIKQSFRSLRNARS